MRQFQFLKHRQRLTQQGFGFGGFALPEQRVGEIVLF